MSLVSTFRLHSLVLQVKYISYKIRIQEIQSTKFMKDLHVYVLFRRLLNLNLPVQYKRADIGRCPYDLNNLFSFANNHNNNNNSLNGLNTPSFPETTASRVLGPPPPSLQSGSKTESTTTTTTTTTSTTTTTTTPTTTTENSATASTTEPPESCGREEPQSFEEAAFVFGNSENSFAEIKFRRKEVVKT